MVVRRRTPFGRACVAVLVCCAVAVAAGCGKRLRTPGPVWPEEWAGRKLHAFDNAFVYASAPRHAKEMRGLVDWANADFVEVGAGATPRRGLVFAQGFGDPLLLENPLELLGLAIPTQPGDEPMEVLSPEERAAMWAGLSESAAEGGLKAEAMLAIVPLSIDKRAFARASGFPEAALREVAWVVVLPTRDTTRAVFSALIDAQMEREEIGFFRRTLVAPVIGYMKGVMVDQIELTAVIALFARQTVAETSWTTARQAEIIAAYMSRQLEIAQSDAMAAMPVGAGIESP